MNLPVKIRISVRDEAPTASDFAGNVRGYRWSVQGLLAPQPPLG